MDSAVQECLNPKQVIMEGKFESEEVVFYPVVCDFLSEVFKEKARRELNETEENRMMGLQEMRDFIIREKLPYATDDNFLLMFLRAKKFNLRKATEKLKSYNLVHCLLMDYVKELDMEKVHTMLDTHMIGCLPYRDRNGGAVFYGIGHAKSGDNISMEEWGAALLALVMFLNSFPMSSVCGLSYISDWSLKSLTDCYLASTTFHNRMPQISALPVRFCRVDVINEIPLIHYLLKAIHHFLPSKIKQRLYFHGKNVDHLNKVYHSIILPSEFGGTFGALDNSSYKEPFLEYLLKLKSMQQRLTTEDNGHFDAKITA